MARNPIPKRKGYADGGVVDRPWARRSASEIKDMDAAQDATVKSLQRTNASRSSAERAANVQSTDIALDRENRALGYGGKTTYPENQPEGYPPPGFAKGGKVKKPMFEGSKKDIKQDKAGARKMGVSMKAYEKTPRDRAEDKAGQRQMYGKRK